MTERTSDADWERGWDGHELAQLRRLAKLSLEAKLDWLEEAQRVAERLARHKGKPPSPSSDLG